MKEAAFERHYRALNSAQREAVDAIEGPVLVTAGPGTGKTQVLILRVANILRLTDTPADGILVLTFTKSAAHFIRERLREIIGDDAYRVNVNTFHGFCNDIILRYPEEFPRIVGSRNISQIEQVALLEQVIGRAPLRLLKPFGNPLHYLQDIIVEIEKLKKENIDPVDFRRLVRGRLRAFAAERRRAGRSGPPAPPLRLVKDIAKQRELVLIYENYEAALRRQGLYDFADMVMEVVRTLEQKPDFLLELQEQFLYLLADEHQDANRSQNRLLELLAGFHPMPNIFVVGDARQAIFQFQGASLENFSDFRKSYPEARLVTLVDNYRSPQTILDAAHDVIVKSSSSDLAQAPPLRAVSSPGAPIRVCSFSSPEREAGFLVKDLQDKLRRGVVPEEIAVLYRDNRDGLMLAEILAAAGVPHLVESDSNLLADLTVRKVLVLFEAIENFGNDQFLIPVLHLDFLDLPPLDVYRLLATAREEKIGCYDLLGNLKTLRRLGLSQPGRFFELFSRLKSWQRLAKNETLIQLFGAVVEQSGLLSWHLDRKDAIAKNRRLAMLYRGIKNLSAGRRLYRLGDFLDYLAVFEKHGLVWRETPDPAARGIRLLTVHRAKGLEFDYIYLIKAEDGRFGGRRRVQGFRLSLRHPTLELEDPVESERRLFYVALTRARKEAVITYAKEDEAGRARSPSRFLVDITAERRLMQEGNSLAVQETKSQWTARPPRRPAAEKSYLNNLFLRRGLSVTDLNNYLECPLKYFFHNLMRIVRIQTTAQFFGMAVHGALKDFFDRYRRGRGATKEYLLSRFREQLRRQPLSAGDYEDCRRRGEAALRGYYRCYRREWLCQIANEFFARRTIIIRPGRTRGNVRLVLKGRIDKLEFLPSPARGGRAIRVVDYKTGRPKSRREILGETRASRGDLFRQLVFYKLLLEGTSAVDKGYRMAVGVLDFVEPDAKGRWRREEFMVERTAVAELLALIERTAGEILSLKFFRRGCGRSDCRYCRLWELSGRSSG